MLLRPAWHSINREMALNSFFMVQRRRRLEQPPPAFSVNIRKIVYSIFAGIFIVAALWLVFVVNSGLFTWWKEATEEEIPIIPPVVEVLNGTRMSGIAAEMTEFLRENGIDSLITGNADNYSYVETIIQEWGAIGNYGAKISELTGIYNITYDLSESQVNVTIILGQDYAQFKPFNR